MKALEYEADVAQGKREQQIKDHFPARPNKIHDCATEKLRPLDPSFHFGSEMAIAYQLQLHSDALAQRFVKYIEAASRCTAYSTGQIGKALIPALAHIRNTAELGTVIALAGDAAARDMDNTPERFASNVLAVTRLFR